MSHSKQCGNVNFVNYISFSLYGNEPRYTVGAIRNAELAPQIYPGWNVLVYHDRTVALPVLNDLFSRGVKLVEVNNPAIPSGLYWRFLANGIEDMERFIVRDVDSRLSQREKAAVDAWIESGKGFHSCRDHPAHAREINGGMWGARKGVIENMLHLILTQATHDPNYGADQSFLCRVIWPLVKDNCLQHDSVSRSNFPGSVPFPTKRKGRRFMGEVYDEHDKARPGDWPMIDPNNE